MKKYNWHIAGAAVLLALLLLLSGCGASGADSTEAPEPTETPSRNAGIASLTLPASSIDELAQVDDYPDLKELDLTGSSLPTAEIAAWADAHPGIDVKYSVLLGSTRISPDAARLTVPAGTQYEELTAVLAFLPNVTAISLPETTLSAEELSALAESYAIDYTVTLLGREIGSDATELDLSGLTPEQVPDAVAALRSLPNLRSVELMDSTGASLLGAQEVKALMEAAPEAAVHYSFELFGKTVSTTDKRIEFVRENIGDSGEAQIRAALDLMPSGTYLLLDSCGLSNEVAASIRDAYPDQTVVWRVFFGGGYTALTDDEVLLITFDLNNDNCGPLQYCTEARYVDVGHNNTLTDLSWVANMPKLECIIVSGAPVSDLSPFANCPNLTWLELCFCYYVTDLTPLSGLQNLKYLNTACSQLQDISPLENVPLERFMCVQYDGMAIPMDQQEAFRASHPDCIAVFEIFNTETLANNPYGYGWRYNNEGYDPFEYYVEMRKAFHYDDGWFGGWKLDQPTE